MLLSVEDPTPADLESAAFWPEVIINVIALGVVVWLVTERLFS